MSKEKEKIEETKPEPKPEPKPAISNERKLRQILWLRRPPLTEIQIERIIEESKTKPLRNILFYVSVLPNNTMDEIIDEFEYVEGQEFTSERDLARAINLFRVKRGLPQFNELPTISYDELVELGIVKPVKSVG